MTKAKIIKCICIENEEIMRKGKTFRKLCFIGTQKTHNVNIKTKCKRKKIEKNKL